MGKKIPKKAGLMMKKGESGKMAAHLSRNQAIRKLQISLSNFRRLCIYKGIYPVDIKGRAKYHKKDIIYLSHDPLINHFREERIYKKKLRTAKNKDDETSVKILKKSKPKLNLDHILKERYPTFNSAVKDLDDALSLIFTFCDTPATKHISTDLISKCQRLSTEFLHYVIASKCLRKVFISIKGFYFQVKINDSFVTFIMPHNLVQIIPKDVDYKILKSFLEFYSTYIEFVNCHLYHKTCILYPPKINGGILNHKKQPISNDELYSNLISSLNYPLKLYIQKNSNTVEIDTFTDTVMEDSKVLSLPELFKGLKFFISREVPKKPFVFAIKSCGGEVSWDDDSTFGLLYPESDLKITHQIMDRPSPSEMYVGRYYVQPQWVFDCINNAEIIPVDHYLPGSKLPPHLSPFKTEKYPHLIPKIDPETKEIETCNQEKLKEKNIENNEQKKLASMSLSRNKKKLYEKLQKIRKSRVKAYNKLQDKRRQLSGVKASE